MAKRLLQPGEKATAGSQELRGVLWDAVFIATENGNARILAYVDGADIAEFFADCLNQQQEKP